MALGPHYTQIEGTPAVTGAGAGLFNCDCGRSLLIAGYEPRNYLGIAIRCASCGRISETPGLAQGAPLPPAVMVIDRGVGQPPTAITGETVLIGREEMERVAALYQPRSTEADPHEISDSVLDGVEVEQQRWTGKPLNPSPAGYKDQPLDWAVSHFRARLRESDWISFTDDADMVAVTVIVAFRDLFASWAHHPLFEAMAGTAAAGGFSLHAMATLGAAKSLALAGNTIGFVPTEGPRPRIASLRLAMDGQDQMSVVVNEFGRFEWPSGAGTTPRKVHAAVMEAIASVQGRINRLRPGILVLSPGAVEGSYDQWFIDGIAAALGSHGKRHRGLAAVAAIFPKIVMTGKAREVRFGYSFYPIANRNHSIGERVRIGTRGDFTGMR